MSQRLNIETLDEDRFARTTAVTLGDKRIVTPNFFTLIKNKKEFNSFIALSMLNKPKRLGGNVIRLFDTVTTVLPKLSDQYQRIFKNGKTKDNIFLKFNQEHIFLIDPSLEYLLYEFHAGKFLRNLGKIREMDQVDLLLNYLKDRDTKKQTLDEKEYEPWKKAFHRKFWHNLDRNPAKEAKFVGDFLELETKCGTDVLIPPVPIVDSESMFDIALRINKLTRRIAPRTKPYATYILLQKGVLRKDALIQKIIAFLHADATQLTIIKIKNLDLWNPGRIVQRENYRLLMDAMYVTRKKNPNKLYIALENWYQSFPSACYGFNIVSTSMHGYDRDSGYGKNVRGSWFDPEIMWYRRYNDLNKIFRNNGNRLPCYCSVCKSITNLENIDPLTWNRLRREHYVLTMNEYMRMINEAIKDRHIELAREKLANSELSQLKNLIPRHVDAE